MSIPYWMIDVHNLAVDEIDRITKERQNTRDVWAGIKGRTVTEDGILPMIIDDIEDMDEALYPELFEKARTGETIDPDYPVYAEFESEIKAERKDNEDQSTEVVGKKPAKRTAGKTTIRITGERRKIHPTGIAGTMTGSTPVVCPKCGSETVYVATLSDVPSVYCYVCERSFIISRKANHEHAEHWVCPNCGSVNVYYNDHGVDSGKIPDWLCHSCNTLMYTEPRRAGEKSATDDFHFKITVNPDLATPDAIHQHLLDLGIKNEKPVLECPDESGWDNCGVCPSYDAETAECTNPKYQPKKETQKPKTEEKNNG